MATNRSGTGKSDDGKRTFIVHADRFGVLTNYEEVHKAALDGRTAIGIPHYFQKGEKVALTEAYIKAMNIGRIFRDSALDRDGLPPIEPVELYEKRLEVQAKLDEAAQAANTDQSKLKAERDKAQREIQEEFERHQAATIMEQFAP